MKTGRIDVHSHLLPCVDDGCAALEESIACAKLLVRAGYTHAFCTPHIWANLTHNTVELIPQRTAELQANLERAGVPLKVIPGGELNFHGGFLKTRPEEVVTYGMRGKYCLFDIWADVLPDSFEPSVRYLQSLGLTVIMAHPERVRAVQEDPGLVDRFAEMGMLLQGNLQCFSDPRESPTRRTVERFLHEDRYFCLGSDTHNPQGMACRLDGLARAMELVGPPVINRLTIENPARILEGVM